MTARQCVVKMLGGKYGKASVRKGTGSELQWLYVKTEKVVPQQLKMAIERRLMFMKLVNVCFIDIGVYDAYAACVSWDTFL